MRKIYINNDRSQIAFFHSVLDTDHVVIESLDGKISVHDISTVGMLDLTERERYEFQITDEKRNFETQRMFFSSFINQDDNITDERFDELFEKSKQLSDKFIQKYKENNQ